MRKLLQSAEKGVNQSILGKELQVRLSLVCILARGHLLLEDIPGIGKTTLAKSLASVLGLHFARIQFTNDLLPSDLLGVSVFEASSAGFVFHPGPIFTHIVLADEINRGTPRTQSALLEVMEEHQVTLDNQTRAVPAPFFVLATQNALDQAGTYPLPDSQLDRFLFRIRLGYPDTDAEMRLLARIHEAGKPPLPSPVLTAETLIRAQEQVEKVQATEALLRYVYALVSATRNSSALASGLSPRAGQWLVRAARAWAFLEGREFLLPEDVQGVFLPVASHRLHPRAGQSVQDELGRILHETLIP